MKKTNKTDHWNLLFSAFLITAFIVCAYFLVGMITESNPDDAIRRNIYISGIFILFGLLLFYATRVGDGKQVWRFSPTTLIIMVIPAAYILFAFVLNGLPFHTELNKRPEILYLAALSLGYGVPYTILSGYELDTGENDPDNGEKDITDKKDGDNADQTESEASEEDDNEKAVDSEDAITVNENEDAEDSEKALDEENEEITTENVDSDDKAKD